MHTCPGDGIRGVVVEGVGASLLVWEGLHVCWNLDGGKCVPYSEVPLVLQVRGTYHTPSLHFPVGWWFHWLGVPPEESGPRLVHLPSQPLPLHLLSLQALRHPLVRQPLLPIPVLQEAVDGSGRPVGMGGEMVDISCLILKCNPSTMDILQLQLIWFQGMQFEGPHLFIPTLLIYQRSFPLEA